ncbi:class II glutamine amidotransferase [Zavarzinia sp. CC-PAN008]|uniref:class II glutamine amidotransferase n=1 Tax=Zavarzinia sp. CC-PAN008 TaxID=3243332 RepID=UPI003F74569F
MCGIVGLYLKNPALKPELGRLLSPMLGEMAARGPDSAGIAVYRDPLAEGHVKLTILSHEVGEDWAALAMRLGHALSCHVEVKRRANHAVLTLDGPAQAARDWLGAARPDLKVMSHGRAIEIYKAMGRPEEVAERFGLSGIAGSHAIGHTRMATESAITTEHSHPFSTGSDICLVHNGSLSNHNRLRQDLRREGIAFQTDNDTEVAAGFVAWRLAQGDSLEQTLERCLTTLDGFYTFAIGTRDGFAVLRDPVACKPAVLAETDDWVAMASEYRAIAGLPGADDAAIWEPKPATLYTWGAAA